MSAPRPEIAVRRKIAWRAGSSSDGPDAIAVEAPLEIRGADGTVLTSIMRTPGCDLELVRGLLFAEGVLLSAAEARAVRPADPGALRPSERGNVVEVDLEPELLAGRWPERSLAVSSACGVCGRAAIESLAIRAEVVTGDIAVPASVLAALPERLRASQEVFHATGGLHAAALFDICGEPLVVREDVGRHSALDKAVGWALASDCLPLSEAIVCVSGRISYELVQKAIRAGAPILVAVSAPSSLAIDLAERFRVTLCGFARGESLNIYSHPARVL